MDEGVAENTNNKMRRICIGDGFDDILEIEIMSRLPVKSLMRFKCVCKRWQSLIQKNPLLIHVHLSLSLKARQGLFIISKHPRPTHRNLRHLPQAKLDSYWTIDLFIDSGGRAATTSVRNIPMREPLVFDKILKPVNGLMCVINTEMFAVCVYNVSTREVVTPWIKSTLLARVEEDHGAKVILEHREYHFGFEPTTKEHKVICVWNIVGRQSLPGGASVNIRYTICEVLTLGNNNTWRKIDEVPPLSIAGKNSVNVNGSIYWTDFAEVILSFKVGSEKFGAVIPITYYITNYRHFRTFYKNGQLFNTSVHILEMDGRMAISKRTSIHTIDLWISDDHYDKTDGNDATASNLNWIKETVALPLSWNYSYVYVHDVVGTNQFILDCFNQYQERSFYLYSRKEKTYRWVQNNSGISQSSPYIVATFVESLLPVR